MTLPSKTLDRDLIRDTSASTLVIEINDASLEVMAFSPLEDNSLIYHSLPFHPEASEPLKAIQDLVYDNPLLLRDWARIFLLVDSPKRLILDDKIGDDDLMTLMTTAFPEVSQDDTILVDSPLHGVTLAYTIDAPIEAFLRRTFFNVSISHRLSPLLAYFAGSPIRGSRRRFFLNLSRHNVDIIAVKNGTPTLANSYRWNTPEDVAYFILAIASIPEIAGPNQPFDLLLAGDSEARASVAPVLSRLVTTAMPVIFPSQMFHAGKDAMKAPFEMAVRPLVTL